MKEDILSQKIRRELSVLPIDTEPRVMYLLVEIRKVLEHEEIKKNSLLGFYGDWVVHTKMDRSFAQKVFKEINDDKSEIGNHIKSFKLLKNELERFFEKHNLPITLISKHWAIFRDKLLDILIDTPIVNDKGNKSFGFHKLDDVGGIQYYLKDDEKLHTLGRVWIE